MVCDGDNCFWDFHVFRVFFSGLIMAVFKVRDEVVLTVHAFFSLPLSLVLTIWFMVVKRDTLALGKGDEEKGTDLFSAVAMSE